MIDLVHINEPHLYITYFKDGEYIINSPYYAAHLAKIDISQRKVTYQVQTKEREFSEITVPLFYHTLSATIDKETGLDIR